MGTRGTFVPQNNTTPPSFASSPRQAASTDLSKNRTRTVRMSSQLINLRKRGILTFFLKPPFLCLTSAPLQVQKCLSCCTRVQHQCTHSTMRKHRENILFNSARHSGFPLTSLRWRTYLVTKLLQISSSNR